MYAATGVHSNMMEIIALKFFDWKYIDIKYHWQRIDVSCFYS